jgi:hypothetical protein
MTTETTQKGKMKLQPRKQRRKNVRNMKKLGSMMHHRWTPIA